MPSPNPSGPWRTGVPRRDARRGAERKEVAEGRGLVPAVMWEKTRDKWKLPLC